VNIYFACAITGGREFEAVYQAIVEALENEGHWVPTAHLAGAGIVALEQIVPPQEVYTRDLQWLQQADALVAEVSTPSHGVGYEIASALNMGKKVLCCHRDGRKISKMITGNTHANLSLGSYRTPEEAVEIVKKFVATAGRQS